jgi:tRNA threonylcarbamoyladenosine modification (KEOPS) complex  Pcc1 subunit
MSIPFKRPENAITKTNWENKRVILHIKAEESKALEAAIENSTKRK